MQSNNRNGSRATWGGFAALWALLVLAAPAGGGASAARVETVLHSFTGGPSDGANPRFGPIAESSGNLYGTTEHGGASEAGTVFKLSPGGTETVLYCFKGGISDGANPIAGLIADSSGNLYGTTFGGGASGAGRCSSSRRAGPRRCCTPLPAATGMNPKPA